MNKPSNPKPIEKSPSISEIEPIEKSRDELVCERKKLKKLVEAPLLKACEKLYDKNIRTLSTSANRKDSKIGYAHMIVEVSTMSPKNIAIAQEVAQMPENEIDEFDGRQALIVHVPMGENTTASEIEEQSIAIASKFVKQPMTWAPIITLDQLKEIYYVNKSNPEYNDPQCWIDAGYYYDKGSDRYFLSEEHFRKVQESKDL